jgi:pyruvate/2-oxoglutarate dehydrogenase complex dihydrolipoamide acyltransferase (E2) component
MSVEFHMPQLGITMEEATIVRWLRDDGAAVQEGEAIVEIETDKTTAEVESTAAGTLRIVAQEGDVVQAGALIAYIETRDAVTVIPGSPPHGAASEGLQEHLLTDATNGAKPAPHQSPTLQNEEQPVRAAPAARALARQLRVNLAEVEGSGPSGRIMPADVEAFATGTQHSREPSPTTATGGENDRQQLLMLEMMGPERETIPLQGIRRTIFLNMTRSVQTTAPCSSTIDVDMSKVVRLRERAKADDQVAGIGVTAIVARALVVALEEFPYMNALALEDGLHLAANINLGIATDTPEGLIVPVIRGVQSLTLPQMHTAIRAMKEAAAQHRLGPDDFAGGTFTLSNLGHLPVRSFAPILNAPQVGIMGIADEQERVIVIEHQMVICPVLTLNLTFDHRWIDGRPAALFLCRVKEILEHVNEFFDAESKL